MRALAATGILLAATASAWAQGGPSFDCAKASNTIERTICANGDLAKADRGLSAAYGALLGRLAGPAKDHLEKDQVRWIGARARACIGTADEVAGCLKERYERRSAMLAFLASGPYPFVSEQSIVKSGKVKSVDYRIDASYPQFDGPAADFSVANRRFADEAKAGAADAVPDSSVDADMKMSFGFDQHYILHRPSAHAISVERSFYLFTGGAHGNGAQLGTLVDLRSGRVVPPSGVFAAGDEWLRTLTALAIENLKKQFVERPGFEEALEPKTMTKSLREAGHYLFRAGRLELLFNPYEVGPYAAGLYKVEIPYARLKPLLRADGPIGP